LSVSSHTRRGIKETGFTLDTGADVMPQRFIGA
jgi:hypothetical protein